MKSDLTNIIGRKFKGHKVEKARVKRGEFRDSDHYGIVLAKNSHGHYVTWQFHLDENDTPNVYWGHYFLEDRDKAIKDFDTRGLDKKLILNLKGRDSWDRPVYECEGTLYVDVDPRANMAPSICTKSGNEFDGEPDSPIAADVQIEFVPSRDTW